MSVGNQIADVLYQSILFLSNNLHIGTHSLGFIFHFISGFSLLNIFAGHGISEPRIGFWNYMHLRFMPQIYSVNLSLLLIAFLFPLALLATFGPEINGFTSYTHPELGYRLKIPKQWIVGNAIPFSYEKTIITNNSESLVTFVEGDLRCRINIAQVEKTEIDVNSYTQVIKTENASIYAKINELGIPSGDNIALFKQDDLVAEGKCHSSLFKYIVSSFTFDR